MAEALGFAASIAGVAGFTTLALQLGQGLIKLKELRKRMRDAPNTLNDAIQGIMAIEMLLQMVQNHTILSGGYSAEKAMVDAPLELCLRSVGKLNAIVDEIEQNWRRSDRYGKLVVARKDREMRDMWQQLEREQSILMVAVQMFVEASRRFDHITTILAVREHHNATVQGFQDLVNRLDRMEDAQPRMITNDATVVAAQSPNVRAGSDESSCTISRDVPVRRARGPKTVCSKHCTLRLRLWLHTTVFAITTTRSCYGWDISLRLYNVVPWDSPMLTACGQADLAMVQRLIAEGRGSLLDRDIYGGTVLSYATRQIAALPDESKALLRYITTATAFPDVNQVVVRALKHLDHALSQFRNAREHEHEWTTFSSTDRSYLAAGLDALEVLLDNTDFDLDWAVAVPKESGLSHWAFRSPDFASSVARRLTSKWTLRRRFKAVVSELWIGIAYNNVPAEGNLDGVGTICRAHLVTLSQLCALAKYGKRYVDNKSTRVSAAAPPAVGISGDALPSPPVELVEHLATFLASWDLLVMRATCRELAAKVQRPYSKPHLTAKKSFLLPDEWSMQALVGISSYPFFSKRITSISLLPLMLMDTTEEEFYARGEWFGLPYGAEHATVEERIAMRQADWTAY
ncbi:hypothetical protein LTR22_018727 [Elasticomyces elasticus]|nr:hypothetical protein LTR22_018727 [Elasticomyces elasticus]